MRNIILYVMPFILWLTSCSVNGAVVKNGADKYSNMPCIASVELDLIVKDNPVKRSESEDSYKVELKGAVEVNDKGDVYIVTDPESRSRRTYLVTGEITRKVASLKGKIIRIKCCFLEKRMWSGVVRVYEILN